MFQRRKKQSGRGETLELREFKRNNIDRNEICYQKKRIKAEARNLLQKERKKSRGQKLKLIVKIKTKLQIHETAEFFRMVKSLFSDYYYFFFYPFLFFFYKFRVLSLLTRLALAASPVCTKFHCWFALIMLLTRFVFETDEDGESDPGTVVVSDSFMSNSRSGDIMLVAGYSPE